MRLFLDVLSLRCLRTICDVLPLRCLRTILLIFAGVLAALILFEGLRYARYSQGRQPEPEIVTDNGERF